MINLRNNPRRIRRLGYSVHSFVLKSLIGDVAFHVVGTSTQLVDLPNRSILYSTVVDEIQVDSGFYKVFTMRISIFVRHRFQ